MMPATIRKLKPDEAEAVAERLEFADNFFWCRLRASWLALGRAHLNPDGLECPQ